MNDIPRYMRLNVAKEYLGLKSYTTLYKFIDFGLPVIVIGKGKYIDRVDADKFMAASKER